MNQRGRRSARIFAWAIASLALAACQTSGSRRAERAPEGALRESPGGKAHANPDGDELTLAGGGAKTEFERSATAWPAGIPSEVPRLTLGEISRTTRSEGPCFTTWGVEYGEIPDDALEAYDRLLAKGGFNPRLAKMGASGQVVAQKGRFVITFIAGKGRGHLSVQQRDRE